MLKQVLKCYLEEVLFLPQPICSCRYPQPLNRARAALFLAIAAREDPGPAFREALRASGSDVETLILLNMAVYLRDHGPRFDLGITRDDVPRAGGETERRLAYLTGEGNPRAQRRRPAPSPSLP